MWDLDQVSAGEAACGIATDLLSRGALITCQPPLINDVRNKLTNVGMHSAGDRKEDAAFGRNGIVTCKEIFQRRKTALSRMGALNGLRKLHRVADQDDVLCARCHSHDSGYRDLAGLIYKQVVEARVKIDSRK